MLEGPGLVDEPPSGVMAEGVTRAFEISLVIRAKIEARPLPGVQRRGVEKFRLHQAVFIVPQFRPRVWKQNVDGRERGLSSERVEKTQGVGPHKMKIR